MAKVYLSKQDFQADDHALGDVLPFAENTAVLTTPLTIGKKQLKNRLVCQAMEGCDGTADGCLGELTRRRYDRFAKGGAGLIWFEATAVLPEGRANPRQLYIREDNLDAFRRQVEQIKESAVAAGGKEPVVIMQATHSGRYSKPTGKPSPLIAYHNAILEKDAPLSDDCILTDEQLDQVKEALIKGASLAERAGFDGVDIKCCHRYLNSELLSAYERPGRYGGDLENRTRLLRESVIGAKEVCGGDFLISTRLNVYDGLPYPYGFGVSKEANEFDPTEPIWLLGQLAAHGVELVNVSMGNPYFNPHINRPFAQGPYSPEEHPLLGVARMLQGTAALKKAVPQMKLICSALSFLGVAAPHVAAAFIEKGEFDLAGFGRTAFAYPDFANDILHSGEMKAGKCCVACSKCTQLMRAGSTPGCVIRDKAPYLDLYRKVVMDK